MAIYGICLVYLVILPLTHSCAQLTCNKAESQHLSLIHI